MKPILVRPLFHLLGPVRLCRVASLFALLLFVPGCATDVGKQREAVLKQSERMLDGYFRGNATEARRSLQEAISIIEKSTVLEPSGRAYLLFVHYSRLYVLEKTAGEEAPAEIALVKGRYWILRALELRDYPAGKALSESEPFNHPEKIEEIVQKADRVFNGGQLPRYAESTAKPNGSP